MAGFFVLELDTSPPDITIFAPSYTTNSAEVEIVVECDEVLSEGFQEFYILDQYGKKHNYTFSYEGSQFVGKTTLSNFDNGFVTFYARVKDQVENLSALVSKTIQIIPSVNYLRLSIDDSISIGEFELENSTQSIDSSILEMESNATISAHERELIVTISDRDLIISDQSDKTEIETEVVTGNG